MSIHLFHNLFDILFGSHCLHCKLSPHIVDSIFRDQTIFPIFIAMQRSTENYFLSLWAP